MHCTAALGRAPAQAPARARALALMALQQRRQLRGRQQAPHHRERQQGRGQGVLAQAPLQASRHPVPATAPATAMVTAPATEVRQVHLLSLTLEVLELPLALEAFGVPVLEPGQGPSAALLRQVRVPEGTSWQRELRDLLAEGLLLEVLPGRPPEGLQQAVVQQSWCGKCLHPGTTPH